MIVKLNVESIDLLIESLNNFKEEITDIALADVVNELTTRGMAVAEGYTRGMPSSNLEESIIDGGVLENGKTGYIALRGPGAVYDEFGTGDEGAADPHPMKGNFPLNPYNSGPTIRVDPLDRHYWVYKPMAGQPYFDENGKTHGIPSGRMMYNTSKYLHSIKKEVIKNKFGDTVKKFK